MPGTRCDLHNIHFAYSWHQVWYILRIYVPNLHITSLIVCVFGAGGGGYITISRPEYTVMLGSVTVCFTDTYDVFAQLFCQSR